MKTFIKYIVILFLLFLPQCCSAVNNEYLAQELLENVQEGEVNLELKSDSGDIEAEDKQPVNAFSSEQKNELINDDDDDDDVIDNVENEFKFFDKWGGIRMHLSKLVIFLTKL